MQTLFGNCFSLAKGQIGSTNYIKKRKKILHLGSNCIKNDEIKRLRSVFTNKGIVFLKPQEIELMNTPKSILPNNRQHSRTMSQFRINEKKEVYIKLKTEHQREVGRSIPLKMRTYRSLKDKQSQRIIKTQAFSGWQFDDYAKENDTLEFQES